MFRHKSTREGVWTIGHLRCTWHMGCAGRGKKKAREMNEAKCGSGCWDEAIVCQMMEEHLGFWRHKTE